jgi:hypothetical protein
MMHDLLNSKTGSLDLDRTIATAKRFGSANPFKSIAEVFGMSPSAMAIRLEKLGFVANRRAIAA